LDKLYTTDLSSRISEMITEALSFGSSTETLNLSRGETEIISDMKVKLGAIFSDGIGKKCGHDSMSSACQIQYGRFKGVVAIDPTSSVKLSKRKSMHKFDANNIELNVLTCSKFQPCYLIWQLITLLSTLGVKDGVFEKKTERSFVDQLNNNTNRFNEGAQGFGLDVFRGGH
jgi:RNA-dependent RNA polymerase